MTAFDRLVVSTLPLVPKAIVRKEIPDVGVKGKVIPRKTPATAADTMAMAKA